MIKSIRLERFKNFTDSTLHLGGFTVIVGTNASGKSNIRDAFRFVHGLSRGYSLAEIIGEKYVEGGVLQWKGIRGGTREAASYGSDSFALETIASLPRLPSRFRSTAATGRHRIQVNAKESRLGPTVRQERFRFKQFTIFDTHPIDDPPAQEPDSPEFIYARFRRDEKNRKHGKRVRFLSTQPIISQLPHSKAVAKYRRIADHFIDELQTMRFLDLSPDAMRIPSFPGQTILGDRGENLSSVLQAICNDESKRSALKDWIRELTPIDVEDFKFIPDQTGRILVSLVESGGKQTSAYSASDGTLRFLAIIAALMGPDPAKFYFLEEIDNGIHPTRLGLLLQLIEQMTSKGDIQVVATTHSPQVLSMLNSDSRDHAVLVYRHARQSEAKLQRIMDIPDVKEVLQQQNLARLHETGWLENVMEFSEPDSAPLEV